jgi:arginine decarboxylase
MPHLISESGRALTAHHALLLIKVIDVESQGDRPVPELTEDHHALLHEMMADYRDASRKNVSKRRVREIFHDLTFDKERAQEFFNSGVFSLNERAIAEQLYVATVNVLARYVERSRDDFEDIISDLDASLVDRYFCNFSLFQSLPDSWAIDQLFPIMPIHRLDEEPNRRGTIQDVTCDSDGKSIGSWATSQATRVSSSTSSATASHICSESSSPVRIRKSSATCTTCSAIRTPCISAWGATASMR